MSPTGLPDVDAVFDALDAEVDRACGLVLDALTIQQQLAVLERCEKLRRRLPVIEHPLLNSLARQVPSQELGAGLSHALTDRILISRNEASRRIKEARDLGPRHGLTGEPIPPVLAATAAAQRAGSLGAGQVAVIRNFYHHLPGWVDVAARDNAEARLAQLGTQFPPEHLAALARTMTNTLNPDGTFTDEDRARSRGVSLGDQQPDGMSALRGLITPELRATLEAVEAKLGAPGMCNPLDEMPCVDGSPSQEAIERDPRSAAQRHHDALLAGLRALLASGELGQHNGLPASIIVTTTLQELEAAAGRGLTGGGTILPMSDVIRLGRHANHYLAIFDKGKALALYHTKRLASPGQRIVLYGKDRGCTAPGCTVSGYYCEVHHVTDYSKCHTTDINDLTFACGPHHRMLQPGGWMTRKNAKGDTEWKPPPEFDRGQPRTNTYHHPEKLLHEDDEDDEDDNPGAA
ncbi:hypothetical protein BST31_23665 [Mycobacterium marseillense]|uniref:HNH endonuclease signature motif containing protein n=1 Tax=Mycobacterium marseillense TaxID=701042 RepID=UPI0009F6DAB7|nr:HNH endonuclease signature motif containing protein [Mycobacterium marseillense]ORA86074.1 hypothetical protein BST31_23665 [Mycobacterium marseillense]